MALPAELVAYLYQEKTEGWLVRVKYEQGMPSYVIIGSGCIRLLLTDLCVFIFETIASILLKDSLNSV